MNLPLHQIFYISRVDHQRRPDIQDIIGVSRTRNGPLCVTGVLVSSGEHFAQVLEAPAETLTALMRSIRRDDRHSILYEWPSRPTVARWYSDWSMGYLQDDTLEVVVEHLSRSASPLPPLEYFVRWLISLSRPNKRSRTPLLEEV